MRQGNTWLCDLRGSPGCENAAAITFICQVEGRQAALCRSCDRGWKIYARENPGLEVRCPNCAPQFLLNRPGPGAALPAGDPILTGPIAEMIDRAMYSQGVLIDIRRKVLARLYREVEGSDDYTAMLLRSTAGVT